MRPYGLSNGQTSLIRDKFGTESRNIYAVMTVAAIDWAGRARFTGYKLSRSRFAHRNQRDVKEDKNVWTSAFGLLCSP